MKKHTKQFLNYLESTGYSPRTVTDYRYNLQTFQTWLTQNAVPAYSDVTKDHIREYQDYLYHEYKTPRSGKSVTLGTQVNLLKVVCVLYRWLTISGYVLQDPTTALKLPKLPKRMPRDILTKREIKKLLNTPDTKTPSGYRDRTILELLYATGIRRNELRNLKCYDIKLDTREIDIRQGKGGADRVVPLTRKAAHYLQTYINHQREQIPGHRESDYLFVNEKVGFLGKGYISLMIRKYLKTAKLKKHITTHSLRHTCATHLLKNKANIRVIQELLGHRSLATTQRYTRVEISDLKRMIDRHHPREEME